MKSVPQDDKIRPGDYVQIINPVIVVRVGYPLSLEDGIAHIEAAMWEEIAALGPSDHARKQIVRALAWDWMRQQKFGGNARTIHQKVDLNLSGKFATVYRIRNAVTGVYSPGYYDSWHGEWDPPELHNRKHHRIATVDVLGDLTCFDKGLDFELENLKKVKPDEAQL